MNPIIPVHILFDDPHWEERIAQGMAQYGYTPRFLHGEVREEDLRDAEILYGDFPTQFLPQCKNLRWLQCSFAGVDRYAHRELYANPDTVVTNAAGSFGITISEHMICVLLMMMRRMPEYRELVARREWRNLGRIRSIYGSTVCVIGMGDIGSNFARRVRAMGARVIGVRRSEDKPAPDWADAVYPTARLEEALAQADVTALCVPSTRETRHLMGEEQFAAMKDGAYLLNVGRGTAIDQEALDRALRAGKLAGAAIDVADPEPLPQDHFLWETPNLILTPHVSGNMSLPKTCDIVVDIFLNNLAKWSRGEPLDHVVDLDRGY